jgi:SWI/SNF-related matrix-associated actin-dependent regulator of chromatin subfamily A member 5
MSSLTEEQDKKPEAKDATTTTADNDGDGDSDDVEIEGMDLDGDDDEEGDEEAEKSSNAETSSALEDEEVTTKLATEDHDEMEAARIERMELMAAEQKQVAAPTGASVEEQLQYLLGQSEVFAHFLAGKSEKEKHASVSVDRQSHTYSHNFFSLFLIRFRGVRCRQKGQESRLPWKK